MWMAALDRRETRGREVPACINGEEELTDILRARFQELCNYESNILKLEVFFKF